jgi:hypothetical protein
MVPPGHLGLYARFSATCHRQITPAHWFAPATNTRHGLAVGSLDNETPKVIKEKRFIASMVKYTLIALIS